MRLRFLALLMVLLLLAGCADAPPAVTPTPTLTPVSTPEPVPTSEPAIQVTVHWDALPPPAEPEGPLLNRWYTDYTGDLVPSEEYGSLVPYIGGEVISAWGDINWCYGLAAADGTIVTDAVFDGVGRMSYYENYRTIYPEPAVIQLGKTTSDGSLRGYAAEDGSWYTGLMYRNLICTSPLGMLLQEDDGDVVMVDWNCEEIFRWPANQIPLPGFESYNIFDGIWQSGGRHGDYYCYISEFDEKGNPVSHYIDLRNGSVTMEKPEGWDEAFTQGLRHDIRYFNRGRIESSDGITHIFYDNGETLTFIPPDGYSIFDISGDRVLLRSYDESGNYLEDCILTDLEGNIIADDLPYAPYFINIFPSDSSLLYCSLYTGYPYDELVLDRNGNELLVAQDQSLMQWGDRLIFTDELYYRVTDLEGSDLLRIPRFSRAD